VPRFSKVTPPSGLRCPLTSPTHGQQISQSVSDCARALRSRLLLLCFRALSRPPRSIQLSRSSLRLFSSLFPPLPYVSLVLFGIVCLITHLSSFPLLLLPTSSPSPLVLRCSSRKRTELVCRFSACVLRFSFNRRGSCLEFFLNWCRTSVSSLHSATFRQLS
jgi:hypothetical protein